jgi:hypothetical protein
MNRIRSGKSEGFAYHFSRYTDGPATFWHRFEAWLHAGRWTGFDSRDVLPCVWSTKPEDTLEWVFWSKNPSQLLKHRHLLNEYEFTLNFTLTGWEEVEHGAPNLERGLDLLCKSVDSLGPSRVIWRFSPIPLDMPLDRFEAVCKRVSEHGLHRVFLNFLDDNSYVPETRSMDAKRKLLLSLKAIGETHGIVPLLCANNQDPIPCERGVCSVSPGSEERMPCGCTHSVDAFAMNAPCAYRCGYCYVDGTAETGRGKLPLIGRLQ